MTRLSIFVVALVAVVVALGLLFGGVLLGGAGARTSRAGAAPAQLKDHCEHIGSITICYVT